MNKEIFKNPFFYFILVPIIVALWPLLVWSVYLPGSRQKFQKEKDRYNKAQKIVTELLTIDPDRLDFASAAAGPAEFDYATAVEKIASLCRIPSANYRLSSGIIMKKEGQKSQSANVVLKDVGIEKFANFLSTIQLRYPNLQCVQLRKLQKKKGLPDIWDVDLEFKYYF